MQRWLVRPVLCVWVEEEAAYSFVFGGWRAWGVVGVVGFEAVLRRARCVRPAWTRRS